MKKNLIYLLLLLGAAYLVYTLTQNKDGISISSEGLTDFAISDTANVGRIVIDDGRNMVDLKRRPGQLWHLNEEYDAMQFQIEVLLKTFAGVGIQQPVPLAQREQIIRLILGDTRKVMIYDLKGDLIKTWYVGRATKTNQGTYALLETPEDGLSSEPYILEMRGFRGYLTTRFHATVADWRWTGLFNYPALDMKQIRVEVPKAPEYGYTLNVLDAYSNSFEALDHDGQPIQLDRGKVGELIKSFESMNVEAFEYDNMTQQSKDSIKAAVPDFRVTVTAKDGTLESADMYWRADLHEVTKDGRPLRDDEYIYVHMGEDLALAQLLNFGKVTQTVEELK